MTSHTLHSSKTTINHVMTMHRASIHANILSWSPVLLMMFPAAVIKCNTNILKGERVYFCHGLTLQPIVAGKSGQQLVTSSHPQSGSGEQWMHAVGAFLHSFGPGSQPGNSAARAHGVRSFPLKII